jgi:hypothetical protein
VRTAILFVCCAAVLSACGIKRPLVAPQDIPAYEQKRQKKMGDKRRFEEEQMRQQNAQTPSI